LYEGMVTKHMGEKYEKNAAHMYAKLKDKQNAAIRYAKKLEDYHDGLGTQVCSQRNPSITVYKLVEQLNAYAKD